MANILGIDVGGSSIKFALFNEERKIIEKGELPIADNFDDFINEIVKLQENFTDQLEGIAISMPGAINTETKMHTHGGALRYIKNVNITKILEEKVEVPVVIQNDAKAAILGEYNFGQLQGYDNCVMLVLGTGVGGAAIVNGKLLKGTNNGAMEVSLLKVNNEVETMETIFAWQNGLHALIEPLKQAKGLEDLDGKGFFEYLLNGDSVAEQIFNTYCDRIAIQLYNLYFILEPEKIAIGGGISVQPIVSENINKRFKARVEKVKEAFAMNSDDNEQLEFEIPEVIQSKLGNDANLYGAVYYFLEEQKKLKK